MQENIWRPCSSCKKPISFGNTYYVCSVSTCNGQRTGYVFCSVACFERHLPVARHKDAGAIEKKAPATASAAGVSDSSQAPQPTNRVYATATTSKTQSSTNKIPRDVLVVASRLKEYVFARSEYNTSQAVMDVLSDHLRIVCDRAIDNARAEGRKTVMDRDFEFLKK